MISNTASKNLDIFNTMNNGNVAVEEDSPEKDEAEKKQEVTLKFGRFAKQKPLPELNPPKYAPSGLQCEQNPSYYHLTKQSEEDLSMKSYVYVTAKNGTNFRLNFTATDATMEPLFMCPRKIIPNVNEKEAQVIAHEEYISELNHYSSVLYNKYPKFVTDPELNTPNKPRPTPVKVYTANQLLEPANDISRPKRTTTTGFMTIKVEDIVFRIRTNPMPISRIKLPTSEEVKAVMRKLNMPSTDKRANRGQLLIRNKNDLLRLSFNMADVVLSKLPERKTQSNQTVTDVVIRTEYNPIGMKKVNLAIPVSTYIYRDPMIDILRLNRQYALLNIGPLWKYELFHKRVAESRGGGEVEEQFERVLKKSRGSFLIFEGFNAVATAVGGLCCGQIAKGGDKYEKKIYNYLYYDYMPTPIPEDEKENSSGRRRSVSLD